MVDGRMVGWYDSDLDGVQAVIIGFGMDWANRIHIQVRWENIPIFPQMIFIFRQILYFDVRL